MRGKKIEFVLSTVIATIVLSSALAPMTLAAFAWNDEDNEQQCQKHKYGDVCDETKKDIDCNILLHPDHTVIHIGKTDWAIVDFTIQAADPVDGIKKVQVHVTDDNTHIKTAVLGGDGFYHVSWTTLGKGNHHVRASCFDFANNVAHDSLSIEIKK